MRLISTLDELNATADTDMIIAEHGAVYMRHDRNHHVLYDGTPHAFRSRLYPSENILKDGAAIVIRRSLMDPDRYDLLDKPSGIEVLTTEKQVRQHPLSGYLIDASGHVMIVTGPNSYSTLYTHGARFDAGVMLKWTRPSMLLLIPFDMELKTPSFAAFR